MISELKYAEVCIIRDDSVTQVPIIYNNRAGISTTVVIFWGIGISVLYHIGYIYCIIFIMHHIQFIG